MLTAKCPESKALSPINKMLKFQKKNKRIAQRVIYCIFDALPAFRMDAFLQPDGMGGRKNWPIV